MCGAHSGPDHDDLAASDLCDAYHAFSRADLPTLERALDAREREMVWQTALGVGPAALAVRLGADGESVRADLRHLTLRLRELQASS